MVINSDVKLDKEKLKQVLHHVISKVGTLDNVGKTVLFKILYFSDFDYYELNEKPITGERYFKLANGPAPSDFKRIISELEAEGKIKKFDTTYGGFPQIKFMSLCNPDLSLLNANELKMIERVINKLSNMTATQVSGYSHEDMPWKATKENEEIDYELVFYRNTTFSVSEEDVEVC